MRWDPGRLPIRSGTGFAGPAAGYADSVLTQKDFCCFATIASSFLLTIALRISAGSILRTSITVGAVESFPGATTHLRFPELMQLGSDALFPECGRGQTSRCAGWCSGFAATAGRKATR